jgi:hypothetical protein
MISNSQFRLVLREVLTEIDLYTANAEELLVATMAHESLGGTYLIQEGFTLETSPALGIYQMERKTHDSLVKELTGYAQNIIQVCCHFSSTMPDAEEMIWNIKYATIMARHYYLSFPEPLPEVGDIDGIFDYYKRFWNTSAGAATKDEFVQHYNEFIGKDS